jgi:hypothetical protein
MGICARERAGEVFPGDPDRYELDPAEGFAEAYRVMAERRAGIQPEWWGIVDELFVPDDRAAAAIEQDVLSPWTQNTTVSRAGSVAAGARRSRSFTISTPLDGILRVTVRPPARSALRLTISAPGGGAALARGANGVRTVSTTVCGQRSVVVRVDRIRGAGSFRLAVSRP